MKRFGYYMTKMNIHFILMILPLAMLLSACGENRQLKELKNYVAQVKKIASFNKKKDSMSQFQLPKPVHYGASESESLAMKNKTPNGNANPLQAYPLKSYRFIGVITENNTTWAYIMTPDNMIYIAKEGDILGSSYGKIIKIDTNQIEVLEKSVDTGNVSSEQGKVIIPLKE